MTQFNPLTGAILQSPMVQQQQSSEKTSQIRRSQQLEKNAALEEDELEHQVESSEELTPTDDDHAGQGGQYKRRGKTPYKGDDGREHVDITG